MRQSTLWAVFLVGTLLWSPRPGEAMLGPGKYSGVVIFDRWGGCILQSGVRVLHISERTKDGLRQFAGRAIQIDAKELRQPLSVGEALVGNFDYLGRAPAASEWAPIAGLALRASIHAGADGEAVATIELENTGDVARQVSGSHLGFSLLRTRDGNWGKFSPADGPSMALSSGCFCFLSDSDGSSPEVQRCGYSNGQWYGYILGRKDMLGENFALGPKEKRVVEANFELPDGEYDFVSGYGESFQSETIASNLCAFNVEGGRFVAVPSVSR